MKKKMSVNYKLLAFVPLMMISGCKNYVHKNVIKEIGEIENNKAFVLEDVETGIERIFKSNDYYDAHFTNYLIVGDTVKLCVGPSFGTSENCYQKDKVLSYGSVGFRYNKDSIYVRRQREQFNTLKQQMQNTQQTR